jgi:hypothetical protein
MLSDDMRTLWPERTNLAACLLPPLPERALPTGYFASGVPERIVTRIERRWGAWWLVGLLNGELVPRERTADWSALGLPPGTYHACEFWSGRYLGAFNTRVAVPLPAHGAAVLALRPAGARPLLLSTSFHISQGGSEIEEWTDDEAAGQLRWSVRLGRSATGRITIWLPPDLEPVRLVSTARVTSGRREAGGLYVVEADVSDHATFALELERRP